MQSRSGNCTNADSSSGLSGRAGNVGPCRFPGFGLGRFIDEMDGIDYFVFLSSGLVASAAMTSASYEGIYSAYTRMVPRK